MPNRILDIRVVGLRRVISVQGITRSDRGTKTIVRAFKLERAGKSKAELKKEVAAAVVKMYPE